MDGRRIDRLPSFIRDLDARPGAVRTLIVAAVAAGAAGLNPPVTWPGNPGVQSAIRAQPQINNLVLGVTVVAAGLLFVGGVIVDTNGRRRILLVSLATLTIVRARWSSAFTSQLALARHSPSQAFEALSCGPRFSSA